MKNGGCEKLEFACVNHPEKVAAVDVKGEELCWDCYYELLKRRQEAEKPDRKKQIPIELHRD